MFLMMVKKTRFRHRPRVPCVWDKGFSSLLFLALAVSVTLPPSPPGIAAGAATLQGFIEDTSHRQSSLPLAHSSFFAVAPPKSPTQPRHSCPEQDVLREMWLPAEICSDGYQDSFDENPDQKS
ncbi:hypothetical protein glysoja_011963 [Glycine soja]|nr:hypothetical protein glysoja_011963 [Glycine soja]